TCQQSAARSLRCADPLRMTLLARPLGKTGVVRGEHPHAKCFQESKNRFPSVSLEKPARVTRCVCSRHRLPTNRWQVLTNFPFQTQTTNVAALDSVTNAANRFHELRMTIPWKPSCSVEIFF